MFVFYNSKLHISAHQRNLGSWNVQLRLEKNAVGTKFILSWSFLTWPSFTGCLSFPLFGSVEDRNFTAFYSPISFLIGLWDRGCLDFAKTEGICMTSQETSRHEAENMSFRI